MKKILLSLFAGTLLLTGCLENTQEITIQEDGSGMVVSTNDMSSLIAMAKQMGGGEQMKDAEKVVKDTTISMEQGADSIPNLTPEEREILRKGTLTVNINMSDDKFVTSLQIPFSNAGQIPSINRLAGKAMGETMKESLGGESPMGGDMPEQSSFDDYYNLEISEGEIRRTLNKEKYAGAQSDEFLAGMQQAAGMGLTMKVKYIYNLPRPVQESEGKGLVISEDKKKVTITADIEDFFAAPEKLEFRIKY